jgi:hypothetical protein
MVNHVVQRYDEDIKPDYELTGAIEALEEYDSDQLWFAHLAMRLSLTRLSDGVVLYSRQFDNRKKVFRYSPEAVVQELSAILEFIMVQGIHDIDAVLAKEARGSGAANPVLDSSKENHADLPGGAGGE